MTRVPQYAALLGIVLTASGCSSDSTSTTAPSSSIGTTGSLSGVVYEVTSTGRVPVAGISLGVEVVTIEECAAPCLFRRRWNYFLARSGAGGLYSLSDLPRGEVVLMSYEAGYTQLCGAGTVLKGDMRLDLEITSSTNPQLPTVLSPLTVNGQIYEQTPSGRVGIAGAWLGLDHHAPDSFFLGIYADASGRYTACGIPPGWQMGFRASQSGFDDAYEWHVFGSNATVDIELRRN